MLNEEKTSCFDEILLAVSKFPEAEQNICKLLAVNPALLYWRAFILICTAIGWIAKGLAAQQ